MQYFKLMIVCIIGMFMYVGSETDPDWEIQ